MPISDETVAVALSAFNKMINEPIMLKCERCDGRGYHHGFGENGHDPDWCEVCGGGQYVVMPGEEERAMRAALEAAFPASQSPNRFTCYECDGPLNGPYCPACDAKDAASQDAPASVPVAWYRVETIIHPEVPARIDTTTNPEVAKGWAGHPNTASLTPLFAAPATQATEWLDIRTAPKDGTKIDLWGVNHLHPAKAGRRVVNVGWGAVRDWMGNERDDWQHGHGEDFEPTHWMPLPAAPTPKAQGEQA